MTVNFNLILKLGIGAYEWMSGTDRQSGKSLLVMLVNYVICQFLQISWPFRSRIFDRRFLRRKRLIAITNLRWVVRLLGSHSSLDLIHPHFMESLLYLVFFYRIVFYLCRSLILFIIISVIELFAVGRGCFVFSVVNMTHFFYKIL